MSLRIKGLIIGLALFVNSGMNLNASTKQMDEIEINETISMCNLFNSQYDKLMKYWEDDIPNWFGGAYIDDECLHIAITEDNEIYKKEIIGVTNNPNITFDVKAHSYDYLLETYEKIVDIIDRKELNKKNKITEVAINEKNNNIEVNAKNDCAEEINKILEENNIDNKIVELNISEEYNNLCSTTVMSGCWRWLYNATKSSRCSIACCATRINSAGVLERGIITAGHCGNLCDVMKINGTSVGKVSAKCTTSSGIDAEFVNFNDFPGSGYLLGRYIATGTLVQGISNVGIWGTMYVFEGMKTGLTAGTVASRNCTAYFEDGTSYRNQIKMNFSIQNGDSGGPLCNVVNNSTYSLVGIASSYDANNKAYFSKATDVFDALNATLY